MEILDSDCTPESPSSIVSVSEGSQRTTNDERLDQDLISSHAHVFEPTYFTRPNRHLGPTATWRSWTAVDRAIADFLDRESAQNLAIHLYNAFGLKARVRQITAAQDRTTGPRRSRSRSQSIVAGKQRVETRNNEIAEQSDFKVPDIWTAWPLPPEELVKHESTGKYFSDGLFSKQDLRPSFHLVDAVVATSLRHAKERWLNRPFSQTSMLRSGEHRNWNSERRATQQLRAESDDSNQGVDDSDHYAPSSGYENNSTARSSSSSSSPSPSADGIQYFNSQIAETYDSSNSENDVKLHMKGNQQIESNNAVFCADDDHVRRILVPSAQHFLSKLDDLLLGLHEQRNAYAVPNSIGRGQNKHGASDVETTDLEDSEFIRSGSRRASRNQSRQEYRGRKRKHEQSKHTDIESEQDNAHAEPRSSQTRTTSVTRSRSRYRNSDDTYKTDHLGLRDWSDILGMATLTGWDTQIISRSAERCARLFGENMMFRTFHEQAPNSAPTGPYYEQSLALDDSKTLLGNESADAATVSALANPSMIPSTELVLLRSSDPCFRCAKQQLHCEPHNPSENLDGKSNSNVLVPCRACLSVSNLSEPCSGISVKLGPRLATNKKILCLYASCSRHKVPFTRKTQLDRHLKVVHGEAAVRSMLAASVPRVVSRIHEIGHDNDVATPELICPVTSCLQRSYKYARPTYLFAHIRHEHPEVDLDSFKELLRKRTGTKQGKYNRRIALTRKRSTPGTQPTEESVDDYNNTGRPHANTDEQYDNSEAVFDHGTQVLEESNDNKRPGSSGIFAEEHAFRETIKSPTHKAFRRPQRTHIVSIEDPHEGHDPLTEIDFDEFNADSDDDNRSF